MSRKPLACLALVLFALRPAQASAGEGHFVVIFGSQWPGLNPPNHTHSWATFVRAVTDGCGPWRPVEHFTISWLPVTLQVRAGKLLPEPGNNLDLRTTLNWALGDGQRVSYWGPFQVTPDLYQKALAKFNYLHSGAVLYKAIDTGFPPERVTNCQHAVSDIVIDAPRFRVGTPAWGESASYFLTLFLSPYMIQPRQTHDWVIEWLGLHNYPLVRRDLDSRNPTRRPLLRATQSLLRLGMRRYLDD